jgi:hypothetical protein
MYQKYIFLQWKHSENTWKLCISCIIYGTCLFWYSKTMYFSIHVKCTKSTCFCSENTIKTHENIWIHMKTLAKLCVLCIIYGTCVFWYTCEMYQKYIFLQWKYMKTHENTWKHMKTNENTSKTVHFMYNIWYMSILVYMWNIPKVLVSAVKTQLKHMKTHENTLKH